MVCFGREYGGDVEKVGLKIRYFLEIIETMTQKCRRENDQDSKKEDKKANILANMCFALSLKTVAI